MKRLRGVQISIEVLNHGPWKAAAVSAHLLHALRNGLGGLWRIGCATISPQ